MFIGAKTELHKALVFNWSTLYYLIAESRRTTTQVSVNKCITLLQRQGTECKSTK